MPSFKISDGRVIGYVLKDGSLSVYEIKDVSITREILENIIKLESPEPNEVTE